MEKDGGKSETVETDFGYIRLVSCRTGVKDLSGLTVGVDVGLNRGWILNKINIEPVAENAKADVLPIFQENRAVNQSWTTDYNASTIFPIWLHNMKNKDVFLTVLGEFEACSEETYKCTKVKQFLNLPLPANESYPTLSCGAIQYALKNAATNIRKTKIKAKNQLLENGDLKIRIVFPKDVKQVDIQSLEVPLKPVFQKTDRFVFTGIFRPETPLKIWDKILLNIRSTNGCFTWNLIVSNKKMPKIPMPLPFGFGFWSGIFFFFLSPLWCAWMMPNKITDKVAAFRKRTRYIQLTSFCAILGFGLCWIMGLNPFLWIENQVVAWGIIIGLIILLIKPVPKKLWVMGTLIFILPKPFGGFLNEATISTKIYLILWWMFCTYIPFNIWLLAPKKILEFFKDVQGQNIPAYGIIVRLPYLILLGWLGISLAGYYHYNTDPTFEPGQTKGPAIVRVVKPVCLSCIKDRAFFLSRFKDWLYQVNPNSDWAKARKELYQVKDNSFYIYIKEDGGEILIPQDLTRSKLTNAINN
ncbi:MAG: hypothetical protein IKS41_01595 [Alphaproteobacteria bacterium]|nr:hypothetical protein [Alphaproteobacteria bacterium]